MGAKLADSGGGGGKRGRLAINSEPNVVPFIDVMLVLLIIFMVAAPIASVDIKVELPRSQLTPSKRPPKPTWVTIKDELNGVTPIKYYVDNDQVTIDTLGEKLAETVGKNSRMTDPAKIREQRVYVRADADTEYRNVMLVMNRLQDNQFTKIGLVVEDRRGR